MDQIVIVGGSLAGVQAADTLRAEGFAGRLTIVDGDWHQPYDRYHLSKAYLDGSRDVAGISLPIGHIEAQWLQRTVAVGLNVGDGLVNLDDGRELPFDGLVVASGTSARPLSPQEMALSGVTTIRTLGDAQALRAALLERPTHVVIIGGGLIGSEIASITAARKLDTTIVDVAQLPLVRTLGPAMAQSVIALHRRNGVRLRYGKAVAAVEGHNGSVRSVRLADGEILPSQLVIVCLGVTPNTSWLEGSGLPLADGLLCDAMLFAQGHPNIVAAGDVARWPARLCGPDPIRVEHWRSTLDQASRAARNLLTGRDRAQPYADLPVFGTHIHGLHFRSNGFPPYATDSEVLAGDRFSDRYVVSFYRGEVLVGLIALEALDVLGQWRARIGGDRRTLPSDLVPAVHS